MYILKIEMFTVDDLPLIREGDDLSSMICRRIDLEDGDVLVIASTVVGKAEGVVFSLDDVIPGERALCIASSNDQDPRFVQAVLDRSVECLLESPIMLVQTGNDHVCINAGIDDSNVDTGLLVGLPSDPDASAQHIGIGVERICGSQVSVIITDTNGRAFKIGQTGVAIGVYRIHPIKNWRGRSDLFGKTMEITEEAVADEVASAANLLMGEGDGGYPVVVVRGSDLYTDDDVTVREMYRPDDKDIIKKGLRCLTKL